MTAGSIFCSKREYTDACAIAMCQCLTAGCVVVYTCVYYQRKRLRYTAMQNGLSLNLFNRNIRCVQCACAQNIIASQNQFIYCSEPTKLPISAIILFVPYLDRKSG